MNKRETVLSKRYIDKLRTQLASHHDHILLSKIHGNEFQERMVDYIGCYKGRFIAIEFKVDDGEVTDSQADYLIRASRNQGLGMVIRFIGQKITVLYYTHEMSMSKEFPADCLPFEILKAGLILD